MDRLDDMLRQALRPGKGDMAPPGFAQRVMAQVQAEPLKENQSIRVLLGEYLPYIAAALVAVGTLVFGWELLPWSKGMGVTNSREAGETILQYRSLLAGFTQIFRFLGSSSIALIFFLSVGLFVMADRLFSVFSTQRRQGSMHSLL
ncbi:MAG TPA: hypothetical protein P5550_02140 [Bacteroidales bacterium]|nr:hypothetical protein [Bacteroidales bacterium]